MSTQREQDESDAQSGDEQDSSEGSEHEESSSTAADEAVDTSGADAAAGDEDEPEEGEVEGDEEEEEAEDDGRILKTRDEIEAEQAAQQPVARNRVERRAQKRRDRRGPEREDRNQALVRPPGSPAPTTTRRAKPPPRKVSGKGTTEDEVPPWAKGFVSWLSGHRGLVGVGAVVVVLVLGGVVGWYFWHANHLAKAAAAYRDALEIQTAPIRAADAPPEPAGTPAHRTFTDRNARAQAALRAFRDVESRYPSAPVANLAKLNEAGLLYDLGRYAEARRAYESLVGKDTAGQEGRVLEGLGFSLEALNDPNGALQRYQELARLDEGAWRDLASFHQARVQHGQGHDDRARDLLHGVIERLHRASPTDEQIAVGGSGSILEQAQALLRDIDPADPLAQPPQLNTGLDNETLQRMFQQRGIQVRHVAPPGGGAGGAPPPAGGSAH